MKGKKLFLGFVLLTMLCATTQLVAQETLTTEEHMASLKAMCSQNSKAHADRQKEKSLHERLGGYDKIHELTREIVRLHLKNESIKPMLKNVDTDNLAKLVADFLSAGTGGSTEYKGRSMPASHAHLKLTDADFLSAGGDIVKAMQSLGHGQDEINEVICVFLSLKDQVVFK